MKNSLFESEADLVRAVKENREDALNHLYKSNYQSILHFILNNNGNEDEAKDIYQEAIIIFYENIRTESFQLTCRIQTYLYSVSRKLWLKRLTSKNRMTADIDDFADYLPIEESHGEDNEEKYASMRQALQALGEPCKTLIEDFYIKRMSMTDISEKFGYTNADNAKNQKYKCLTRLKRIFFENYKRNYYEA